MSADNCFEFASRCAARLARVCHAVVVVGRGMVAAGRVANERAHIIAAALRSFLCVGMVTR